MKKLFIAAIMVVTLTASAFAAPVKVNVRITSSFEKDFATATNLSWTLNNSYAKASFLLDGKAVEAFYDLGGEKIGVSKAITVSCLPKKAQSVLTSKYADYKVTEAISFDKAEEGETHYVSMENEKSKVVLEVSAAGDVSLFSKKLK